MKYRFVVGFLIFVTCWGCQQKSEYRQWVQQELNKDIQKDSLFLGYRFGMTQQEFYDHSWSLNSQGKVRQGAGNLSVMEEMDSFDFRAQRNFYPKFHNDKIYIMPVKYSYNGWAPWNKNRWSDSLIIDVIDFYEKTYETKFKKMMHPILGKEAYISIEGNRAITIFREDDQYVTTTFTDTEVMQKAKQGADAR